MDFRAIPCDFYNAAVSGWDGAAATVRQTAGRGIDGTGGVVVVRTEARGGKGGGDERQKDLVGRRGFRTGNNNEVAIHVHA